MPFQLSDVSKHNKRATTDKLKRKWVAVANNALIRCEVDERKNCDAEAIRIANSVIKHDLAKSTKQQKPAGFRESTSKQKCANCQYFELAHCVLYDYPVDENDWCKLYMPVFDYRTKID